jgi:indolepyruvate ferredoxin oxidoreductase
MEAAPRRVFINPLVCEGCGDCSRASNCVSVEPLETVFGRKRRIDQSTCNQDYSCVDGFCPSFVTLEGAEPAAAHEAPALTADSTPLPEMEPLAGVKNILLTGVGGTGVTTAASVLAMAAHIDGLNASVVDMTGLAQKGGAVFSHVRLGQGDQAGVRGRVPAASADVLIACDALVAASPEALALYAKSRTAALANTDLLITADFVTDRDARFESAPLERRLASACNSFAACPAASLAQSRLGDTVFANMIILGFAWQKGLIPVSSRALYRAINLNGVAAAANLQAFELGRRTAHDPATALSPPSPAQAPQTMPLDELIAHRAKELEAYQDGAYARRYGARIAAVRAAEAALGSEALTRTAAINLYRLMAYKDEYEVARLYADGRFAAELGGAFSGGKIKVWLAPPLLGAKDDRGHPRKIAFGGWMVRWGFPLLARLKGLRGTPLDLFGATPERRMERGLIASYETSLDRLAAQLTAERLALAVQIAEVPGEIRGFGHVKASAAQTAARLEAALWAKWDA